MTARTPLYYDGSGSLIELSSAEIVEYQRQAIKQYADNPSVTCSVVSSSGTISPQMDDTRLRSSAAAQQNSSHPGSGSLTTVTTSFDKISQTKASVSVSGDTNNVAFPVYYDSSAGAIQSMTEADFVDTFIKPAIDLMVASSEAVAGDYGGTFTIHTGTSLANHTLISSTAVFIDTRADTSEYTSGQIGSAGSFQTHNEVINSFFLHRRDAVDNTPARTMLFIENDSGDHNLKQYADADIESLLAEYIRNLAVSDSVAADHQIDYNINGSGDARGTAMTDTKLDGSGSETNRFVSADDYRSQKFPNGSATTISTFTFKINKS